MPYFKPSFSAVPRLFPQISSGFGPVFPRLVNVSHAYKNCFILIPKSQKGGKRCIHTSCFSVPSGTETFFPSNPFTKSFIISDAYIIINVADEEVFKPIYRTIVERGVVLQGWYHKPEPDFPYPTCKEIPKPNIPPLVNRFIIKTILGEADALFYIRITNREEDALWRSMKARKSEGK